MSSVDLSDLDLWQGLSDGEVAKCVARFRQRQFHAGESLASQGEFAYKFFVVLDGEVDVDRDFEFVARIGPGQYFGETGLLDHGRRNARVTTHDRAVVAWMMAWDFSEMIEEHPVVGERLEVLMEERRPDS